MSAHQQDFTEVEIKRIELVDYNLVLTTTQEQGQTELSGRMGSISNGKFISGNNFARGRTRYYVNGKEVIVWRYDEAKCEVTITHSFVPAI